MSIRRPTELEYLAFDGMHCSVIWADTPRHWRCPSCRRSKLELMRWGKRTGNNAHAYGPVGWKAALHRHHDHGDRWTGEIVICGDCNSADGTAKRLLQLPRQWSFRADEIGQFVTVVPNGGIAKIDLEVALAIYTCAVVTS